MLRKFVFFIVAGAITIFVTHLIVVPALQKDLATGVAHAFAFIYVLLLMVYFNQE